MHRSKPILAVPKPLGLPQIGQRLPGPHPLAPPPMKLPQTKNILLARATPVSANVISAKLQPGLKADPNKGQESDPPAAASVPASLPTTPTSPNSIGTESNTGSHTQPTSPQITVSKSIGESSSSEGIKYW